MPEGPARLEDVPSDARDAVLTTPADFGHAGQLGIQIRAHWQKYRPGMTRELEQAGTLDAAIHTAEALTVSAYQQALDAGLAPDQARELVREEWAFLPDEDDVTQLVPERDPRTHVSGPATRESEAPRAPARPSRGRNLKPRS